MQALTWCGPGRGEVGLPASWTRACLVGLHSRAFRKAMHALLLHLVISMPPGPHAPSPDRPGRAAANVAGCACCWHQGQGLHCHPAGGHSEGCRVHCWPVHKARPGLLSVCMPGRWSAARALVLAWPDSEVTLDAPFSAVPNPPPRCACSPHIRSIHERIAVGGAPIPPAELDDLVARHAGAIEAAALRESGALSHFEIVTALAYKRFQERQVGRGGS